MKHMFLLVLLLPLYLFGAVITHSIENAGLEYNHIANSYTFSPNSDYVYTSAPGSYRLPVKTVNIVLPPDAAEISTSFRINSLKSVPAKQPEINTPFSDGDRILQSQPALQPNEHVIFQGTGKWGDVTYARFAVLPALYNANSRLYEFAEQVTISISYNSAQSKPKKSSNVPQLLSKDSSFINTSRIAEWYPHTNQRTYDYLIVTTPALYSAAQSLVSFHQNQGMVISFADISTVLATSTGTNPADKLRNYLVTEYINSPFTYLLLIGDIDVIPIAYLTPEPNGDNTVPSDFYYSDLSSNFDNDFDGKLGEYNTGMDYTPEVMVGRIPWNDANTVSQICTRIVNFESANPPWKRNTLLPAAILNYADEVPDVNFERTDGATFMEYCKSTVLRNYQNTTMYEQAGLFHSIPSDYMLKADTLSMLLNTQNYGIVNWSAHGSPTSSARKVWLNDTNNDNLPNPQELQWYTLLNIDTFDNLTNQSGSVFFCASCQNGMIDHTTASLGEYLLATKAVANIAATRTGWYKLGWENPGWGGLSSYNYHFLENYANNGMTVGQAHGFANWLHTQYCLFGDPIDDNGIIWPELQNIYTYLLYGDPAIGYPSQVNNPAGQILVWEPLGNTGNTVVNGLLEVAPFNVVYTDHLIENYNYLNQFDAVFCLFGLGYGQNVYTLQPDSLEYSYLLDYLQQGGKVYMEGMVNWDPTDSLFSRFGTWAPFDHVAYIEQLRYTCGDITQIWDYDGYNEGTPALEVYGTTSQPLFHSYNQVHVNDVIGIWNRIGESRTISSSFELAGVYSDLYTYPEFLSIILDTLGVLQTTPVSNNDENITPAVLEVFASPNPFNNSVNISAKSSKPVRLSVYNIKGQMITTTRLFPQNGKIQWVWDGKNSNNNHLAAGIYLFRLENGSKTRVIKTLKLN